jgi:hypothetical protein
MLRAFGGVTGVRASQEFVEGTLLGLAERVPKISHTVRVAGGPRERDSGAVPTPGIRSHSCFQQHHCANRATVFADP